MNYIRDMKTLGERLAWARARKGISQGSLAKVSGVSQSAIGNIEAGGRDSARRLARIAYELGVDALWLEEGTGEPFEFQSAQNGNMGDAAKLLHLYSSLTEQQRHQLMMFLKSLVSKDAEIERPVVLMQIK